MLSYFNTYFSTFAGYITSVVNRLIVADFFKFMLGAFIVLLVTGAVLRLLIRLWT